MLEQSEYFENKKKPLKEFNYKNLSDSQIVQYIKDASKLDLKRLDRNRELVDLQLDKAYKDRNTDAIRSLKVMGEIYRIAFDIKEFGDSKPEDYIDNVRNVMKESSNQYIGKNLWQDKNLSTVGKVINYNPSTDTYFVDWKTKDGMITHSEYDTQTLEYLIKQSNTYGMGGLTESKKIKEESFSKTFAIKTAKEKANKTGIVHYAYKKPNNVWDWGTEKDLKNWRGTEEIEFKPIKESKLLERTGEILIISNKNPLSTQLQKLTGKSYNAINFIDDTRNDAVIEKGTGRTFIVFTDTYVSQVDRQTLASEIQAIEFQLGLSGTKLNFNGRTFESKKIKEDTQLELLKSRGFTQDEIDSYYKKKEKEADKNNQYSIEQFMKDEGIDPQSRKIKESKDSHLEFKSKIAPIYNRLIVTASTSDNLNKPSYADIENSIEVFDDPKGVYIVLLPDGTWFELEDPMIKESKFKESGKFPKLTKEIMITKVWMCGMDARMSGSGKPQSPAQDPAFISLVSEMIKNGEDTSEYSQAWWNGFKGIAESKLKESGKTYVIRYNTIDGKEKEIKVEGSDSKDARDRFFRMSPEDLDPNYEDSISISLDESKIKESSLSISEMDSIDIDLKYQYGEWKKAGSPGAKELNIYDYYSYMKSMMSTGGFPQDQINQVINYVKSLNESKISEIRSLVQINIYWDGKRSFSLNYPGGGKVFNGSPEGFAKFLQKLGAKEVSTTPRSLRTFTYKQIVDDIMSSKDPNIYVWSNRLAGIPERIINESQLKEEQEDCPNCKGKGQDEEGDVCIDCNGSGKVEVKKDKVEESYTLPNLRRYGEFRIKVRKD